MRASITIAASLTLIMAASSATAQESIPWDSNCSPVNNALRRTWSAERFSAIIYEVKSDGEQKPSLEARFTDSAMFERSLSSERNKWVVYRREGWSAWDKFGPKYAGCKLAPEDKREAQAGSRYTA